MLYKDPKPIVHFAGGDTGVYQEDRLAPFLFIICLDYVQQASNKNI